MKWTKQNRLKKRAPKRNHNDQKSLDGGRKNTAVRIACPVKTSGGVAEIAERNANAESAKKKAGTGEKTTGQIPPRITRIEKAEEREEGEK